MVAMLPRSCTLTSIRAEFETGRFNALQLSFDELRCKASYSKGHDQVTHPDRPRDNGGELYRGRHLLSIYNHRWQALAPYFGGRRLLFALEGEIPVRGPGPRNP